MQVVLTKYIDDTLQNYNNPDTSRCFITHANADQELVDSLIEYVKAKNIFKKKEEHTMKKLKSNLALQIFISLLLAIGVGLLMGDQVEPRRDFIIANSKLVTYLDV